MQYVGAGGFVLQQRLTPTDQGNSILYQGNSVL